MMVWYKNYYKWCSFDQRLGFSFSWFDKKMTLDYHDLKIIFHKSHIKK
jgi:hypothetical protein